MQTPTSSSATMTPKIIELLNTCIETCIDGEKAYAISAANVRDEVLKDLFHKYSTQREGFVRALQKTVEELGGHAENQGSAKGAVYRAFAGARLALEGRTDEVILGECERGELESMAVYNRAFFKASSALPPPVHTLLVEQARAIQAALDDITREDIKRRLTHQ